MGILRAPNKNFTGTVFGHSFIDGEVEVDKNKIKKEHLAYFARKGYVFDETPGEDVNPEDNVTPEKKTGKKNKKNEKPDENPAEKDADETPGEDVNPEDWK